MRRRDWPAGHGAVTLGPAGRQDVDGVAAGGTTRRESGLVLVEEYARSRLLVAYLLALVWGTSWVLRRSGLVFLDHLVVEEPPSVRNYGEQVS